MKPRFYLSCLFCINCCFSISVASVVLPDLYLDQQLAADSDAQETQKAQQTDHDTTESIGHLPGVVSTQMTGYGSGASFSIRGFGGDASSNTALIVDGLSQVNASQVASISSTYIPFNIDSIDLYEQSSSVLFGNHAVGGVIELNFKPLEQQSNAFLQGFGSYSTTQSIIQLTSSHDQLSLVTSLRNDYTKNYRDHNRWSSQQMRTAAGAEYDNWSWQWSIQAGDESLELPGALSEQQVNEDRQQSTNNQDIIYSHPLNTTFKTTINLDQRWDYQSQFQLRSVTENGYQAGSFTSDDQLFQWHQFLESREPGWLGSCSMVGMDFLSSNYHYDTNGYHPDANELSFAVFGQSSLSIRPKVKLIIGQRFAWNDLDVSQTSNQWSSHDSASASSQALQYNVTQEDQLSLRRATSYRFPTTDESAWTRDGQPLDTQTGTSYELRWQKHHTRWRSDVGLYDLLLDNEILYVPYQDSLYFGYNENLPPTSRVGSYISFIYRWNSVWQSHARYDWVNAKVDSGVDRGSTLPFVAEQQAIFGMDFIPNDAWKLVVDYRYVGQRYAIGDIDNVMQPESGYGLVDVSVNFHRGHLIASLALKNLTNVKYNEAAVLSTNSDGQQAVYYYPAPRFNTILTVSYMMR